MDSGDEVSLITTAKKPRLDWRHRKRVYAALQLAPYPAARPGGGGLRLLHSPLLAAFFAVLPLPWVAVLLANEKAPDTEKGQPKVYKPALVRQQRQAMRTALESGTAGTHRPQLDGGDSAASESEVIDAEPEDTPGEMDDTGSTDSTESTERNEDPDER